MSPAAKLAQLDAADLAPPYGTVRAVMVGAVRASGPAGALGDLCEILRPEACPVAAELAAVSPDGVTLVPLDPVADIAPGHRVTAPRDGRQVPVGDGFAGRMVDALGRPIDGDGLIVAATRVSAEGQVPRPLDRSEPRRILETGVRAVDGLMTLGVGQRVGIFAAAGVGKTSLIEQMATQVSADRCILCLVGERGREVEAAHRLILKSPASTRYTIVAATSDESAAMRGRAVPMALSLAEYWRDRGEHVLVIIDSITRTAMALREIGLAAGAPPTARAYTPNVFAALPRIVERCGAIASGGAISALMTVLSESDEIDDPIVELMKSLLDGHIVLSRALAEQGHFPAIDIGRSVSRLSDRLTTTHQSTAARRVRATLATYEEARIMIDSGVYRSGSNPAVDRAIAQRPAINNLLRQTRDHQASIVDTFQSMTALSSDAN